MRDESLPSTLSQNREHRFCENNRNLSLVTCLNVTLWRMSLSPPLFLRIENTGFLPIIRTCFFSCHNVLPHSCLYLYLLCTWLYQYDLMVTLWRLSLPPPLFLRIENTGFAPIIGTCHNILQPETVVTDWWQLSNGICFLANFDRWVHSETVVWSILKWPRGPNAMGGGKIMRIKRGNIGAKNVRLYSALWAEKGGNIAERAMSGAGISPLCAKIIWVLCSEQQQANNHEKPGEAWHHKPLLDPVQSEPGSLPHSKASGLENLSRVRGRDLADTEFWELGQASSSTFKINKTVCAPICLTSEPPNRQDVLRGIVQWRSGHKMAHKVCPFLKNWFTYYGF